MTKDPGQVNTFGPMVTVTAHIKTTTGGFTTAQHRAGRTALLDARLEPASSENLSSGVLGRGSWHLEAQKEEFGQSSSNCSKEKTSVACRIKRAQGMWGSGTYRIVQSRFSPNFSLGLSLAENKGCLDESMSASFQNPTPTSGQNISKGFIGCQFFETERCWT